MTPRTTTQYTVAMYTLTPIVYTELEMKASHSLKVDAYYIAIISLVIDVEM